MNDHMPPTWEIEAISRERLARIETKVDMILVSLNNHDNRMNTLEARQTALEAGRMANRADIDAALLQIREWSTERREIGMTGAQFINWRLKIDQFMEKVNNGTIVVAAAAKTRKQDMAALGGALSMAVMFGGAVAKLVFG